MQDIMHFITVLSFCLSSLGILTGDTPVIKTFKSQSVSTIHTLGGENPFK